MTTPKRFYTTVTTEQQGAGWSVLLDGRILKTPTRRDILLNQQPLVEALAEEWRAQGERIEPDTMPVMRIVSIALDRTPLDRADVTTDMLGFIDTDLVCYRADQANVAERQARAFAPVIDFIEKHYHLTLNITDGLLPLRQPASLAPATQAQLAQMDDLRFTALAFLTPLTGSLFAALALAAGALSAEDAYLLSRIEEDVQAELYGADPEVEEKLQSKQRDILAAGFVLRHA
jgi:chaperone required for assembly of F1-ATPase